MDFATLFHGAALCLCYYYSITSEFCAVMGYLLNFATLFLCHSLGVLRKRDGGGVGGRESRLYITWELL